MFFLPTSGKPAYIIISLKLDESYLEVLLMMGTRTQLVRLLKTTALACAFALSVFSMLAIGQVSPVLALMGNPAPMASGGITTTIQTGVSDFAACSWVTATPLLTNTIVSSANGGEIRLASILEDYFDSSSLDTSKWLTSTLVGPNTPYISGGIITFSENALHSVISLPVQARYIQIRARVDAGGVNPDMNLGFGRSRMPGPPTSYGGTCPADGPDCFGANRLFITAFGGANFDDIKTNVRDLTNAATIVTVPWIIENQYHVYEIQWNSLDTRYLVDNIEIPTSTFASALAYSPYVWMLNWSLAPMTVDWMRVNYYPSQTGTYESCVFDGGQTSDWTTLSWGEDVPVGTSSSFETQSSSDGVIWSGWSPVSGSGGAIQSPRGRYLQYRALLTTTNINVSPQINSITVKYETVANLQISKKVAAKTTSDVVTYTVYYTNTGISQAEDVSIVDTLPPSMTYRGMVVAVPPLAGPTQTLNTLQWYAPALAAGATGTVVYTATLDAGASGRLTNTVQITGTAPINLAQNAGEVGLDVNGGRPTAITLFGLRGVAQVSSTPVISALLLVGMAVIGGLITRRKTQ
jgi:uncharacterized repeat protein (TIGR01451 family)